MKLNELELHLNELRRLKDEIKELQDRLPEYRKSDDDEKALFSSYERITAHISSAIRKGYDCEEL